MVEKCSPDGAPAAASNCRPDGRRGDVETRPVRLKKRRDFLSAAKAGKHHAAGFVLQARQRQRAEDAASDAPRIGFTASKKVGGAVARNRAKRRLRAVVDAVASVHARPGWDYVLIARADATAARPFPELCADLERAFAAVHAPRRDRPQRRARADGDGAKRSDGPKRPGGGPDPKAETPIAPRERPPR